MHKVSTAFVNQLFCEPQFTNQYIILHNSDRKVQEGIIDTTTYKGAANPWRILRLFLCNVLLANLHRKSELFTRPPRSDPDPQNHEMSTDHSPVTSQNFI